MIGECTQTVSIIQFSEIGAGQNLMIPSGGEVQFAWIGWEADPTYGDLQLYGPTNELMDYIQWGGSGNLPMNHRVCNWGFGRQKHL